MTGFRVRLRRLLPGSLDEYGNVIDHEGKWCGFGPCFIPASISPTRKGVLGENGWCKTPASHWPSLPPAQGLVCIHRGPLR